MDRLHGERTSHGQASCCALAYTANFPPRGRRQELGSQIGEGKREPWRVVGGKSEVVGSEPIVVY